MQLVLQVVDGAWTLSPMIVSVKQHAQCAMTSSKRIHGFGHGHRRSRRVPESQEYTRTAEFGLNLSPKTISHINFLVLLYFQFMDGMSSVLHFQPS